MTRKWGSCSSAGTITLACDLLDESDSFQDFVVAHELLHLRIRNHGRLFKALMTAHVPGWRTLEISRMDETPSLRRAVRAESASFRVASVIRTRRS